MDEIPFTYTFRGKEYTKNIKPINEDDVKSFLLNNNDLGVIHVPTDDQKQLDPNVYTVLTIILKGLYNTHFNILLYKDEQDDILNIVENSCITQMSELLGHFINENDFTMDFANDIRTDIMNKIRSKLKNELTKIKGITNTLDRNINLNNEVDNNPNNNQINNPIITNVNNGVGVNPIITNVNNNNYKNNNVNNIGVGGRRTKKQKKSKRRGSRRLRR